QQEYFHQPRVLHHLGLLSYPRLSLQVQEAHRLLQRS
ncbi:unnamed protein product, partial [marine sediment metagenome]